ncbi:hypothetical protein [Limnospira platensis]|uniref:hypothetical protein n=1 Tax=Limnospira platensis TaxID=118562 RepID=UPI003D6F42D0
MLNYSRIFLISALGLGTFFPNPAISVPHIVTGSPLLLAQNQPFQISGIQIVKNETLTAGSYTVEGRLINYSSDVMRSLQVVYRLYRQEGDILVEVESHEATVIPGELQPGETGKFGWAFSEVPQVFFIEAIVSENGTTEVNQCYADGLARREMCRLQLNSQAVYPLTIKH